MRTGSILVHENIVSFLHNISVYQLEAGNNFLRNTVNEGVYMYFKFSIPNYVFQTFMRTGSISVHENIICFLHNISVNQLERNKCAP